ncbi:hypothetical protein MUK60_00210 [Streptomyces sp. LRE541]|uniref:hypothetical protein n=1 Tax=Streptomyces sp. LRE541 TaxID=2931983 RepID=UPI00200D75E7|nr:hypothetical protein [Streptomyces sp. LRE541]UPZ26380.1 hypothetical protein MUK60_00210 [Streptomyces sp. LRE541]
MEVFVLCHARPGSSRKPTIRLVMATGSAPPRGGAANLALQAFECPGPGAAAPVAAALPGGVMAEVDGEIEWP